jgi:hypothetical protein
LSERSFYRANRSLLVALLGISLFLTAAELLTKAATNPALPTTRFNIASAPNSSLKFWIFTWETYTATLWIGQPAELDRKTFDLITGCKDSSIVSSQDVLTPKWAIRSVRDQSVLIQGEAILVNPPANECTSTTGGHVFSLGKFAIAPGRYQFEIKFSANIPESMSFPAELNIRCCARYTHTRLGRLMNLYFFFGPLLVVVFAFLMSLLVIRAVLYARRINLNPTSETDVITREGG